MTPGRHEAGARLADVLIVVSGLLEECLRPVDFGGGSDPGQCWLVRCRAYNGYMCLKCFQRVRDPIPRGRVCQGGRGVISGVSGPLTRNGAILQDTRELVQRCGGKPPVTMKAFEKLVDAGR